MRWRKAQAWYLDLVAGMLIFIVGLVIFFNANTNIERNSKLLFEELSQDANGISSQMLTPGYPNGWDIQNVELIGVVDNGKINPQKWSEFQSIPYNLTKRLLGVSSEYLVFIEENNKSIARLEGVCAIGFEQAIPEVDADGNCMNQSMESISHQSLSRKERHAFLESRTVSVVVFSWA